MAYIEARDPHRTTEDSDTALDDFRRPDGIVDNIVSVQTGNLQALEDHMALYKTLMYRKSGLRRRDRELLALITASTIGCHY